MASVLSETFSPVGTIKPLEMKRVEQGDMIKKAPVKPQPQNSLEIMEIQHLGNLLIVSHRSDV